KRFARHHVERDAIHRAHGADATAEHAATDREMFDQVAHREQWRRALWRRGRVDRLCVRRGHDVDAAPPATAARGDWRRPGSAARWHRETWPLPIWYRGGGSTRQRSHAYEQRS